MPKNDEKSAQKPLNSIDPNDEFPISVDVYCRLKHSNALTSRIFTKAMFTEARYKKFYIKEWDQKYKEFFNRSV